MLFIAGCDIKSLFYNPDLFHDRQILDMNELTTSKELPHNKDMKYKLRFITMHEDQGGGFQGNEEGTEDEETPQAHCF